MTLQLNQDEYQDIQTFLYHEAKLLDDWKLDEWLDVLTDDIRYHIPIRITRERGSETEFNDTSAHIDDNKYRLRKRVERLETEYAWAEDPASRTRHLVSNILITNTTDGEYDVTSNFILYRNRGDDPDHDLLSGERKDVLRRVNDELKITERTVLLDQSTLDTHNISFFI